MRLRVAGHPLHPALAHFPVALLTVAPLADALATGFHAPAASIGWWAMAVGLAAAVPTMLAGIADYAGLPKGHRANDTAIAHMLAMGSSVLLFMLALALREWPPADPGALVLGIELVALLVLLAGGWLGGSLVYRHGVGVEVTGVAAGD